MRAGLACGKKSKMLKRHLATKHDTTPEEYRESLQPVAGVSVVAPNYAATRSELAKKAGLGRKPNANRGRKPRSTAGKNGDGRGFGAK